MTLDNVLKTLDNVLVATFVFKDGTRAPRVKIDDIKVSRTVIRIKNRAWPLVALKHIVVNE